MKVLSPNDKRQIVAGHNGAPPLSDDEPVEPLEPPPE